MRASGILLPIFSLPSNYGIGTLGEEAYKFVDFLHKSGQKYWQMLPIGPISYGDSPYQSFSSYAGNPYFIDLDLLCEDGVLSKKDYSDIEWCEIPNYVEYGTIFKNRFKVLKIAFENGYNRDIDKINKFRKDNAEWIEDYALFMAVKNHFELVAWKFWDEDIRLRTPEAILKYSNLLKENIDFWIYTQYLFYKQWTNLKTYANKNGIKLIGDIPIYVAEDSADAWANNDIFLFDENLNPIKVAGCPPDAFSEDGQLWGNPLYRWDVLENRNYDWWISRVSATKKLFDVIRIDHFRGFDSYYAIPYGSTNARKGEWLVGPGIKFIKELKKQLKGIDIIAEDLGFLTPSVEKLLKDSGFPGMKVLEFAFDSREESDYLPHNYNKNTVVYTGTHDNDTIMGWFNTSNKRDIAFAKRYLRLSKSEGYNWGMIRGAWSSVSNLAVAQMQDFLGLGSSARTNIPSTIGQNWKWRLLPDQTSDELADRIKKLTKLYKR